MFFGGWDALARVMVVGVLAYVGLLALLRVSGKRTLSKMNAFDLVVTVALGSTLATILLSREVSLAEGVLAFALLIGLQFAITWLSARSGTISRLIRAEPSLLLYRGEFLREAMLRQRVNESEVLQALRAQGVASREDAEAVVLETDGSFSVVRSSQGSQSALSNLENPRNRAA